MIRDGEGDSFSETVVWWGATLRAAKKSAVAGPSPASTAPIESIQSPDSIEKTTWELHYDARDDMGFPPEIRPVVLLTGRSLEDPGEGSLLRWRLEGDADDDAGDDSFDAEPETQPNDPNVVHVAQPVVDADGNVSIADLLSAQREVDARNNGGIGLEQQGAEAFGTLPMDSQQKMATAFAGLKNGLSAAFAELQQRNGADYAITKDDIAEIMRGMHR